MKIKLLSLLVIVVALFFAQASIASSLMYKCINSDKEEFMEIYLGEKINHFLVTKRVSGSGLVTGESASWSSEGHDSIFAHASLISSRRMIEMKGEKTSDDSFTLHLGYYLDPACPSCQSRHYSHGLAHCKLKKKMTPDTLSFYSYKREAHYPIDDYYFQNTMREVGDDHWSPRAQITLVAPGSQEFLVINFVDGYIRLNGWSKNSGSNAFMEESIRRFLKSNPLVLEEATTKAGKCQFEALMKKRYPSNACLKLLDNE